MREKSGVYVAQPKRTRDPRSWRRLVNDPGNKIPVLVQRDRNYGLNIQNRLRDVVMTNTEIKIVLKWNADEVSNGILCFFG